MSKQSDHSHDGKPAESGDSGEEEEDSGHVASFAAEENDLGPGQDDETDPGDKKPEAYNPSSGHKRARRVMTREEILAKARTRSRIRRQKNKEYYDEMQREVFTLIQSNAQLRKQNNKLEAIIKIAKEKILSQEMNTWEKIQQVKMMSSMKANLFSRQAREAMSDSRSQGSSSLLRTFMEQNSHRLSLGNQKPQINEATSLDLLRRYQCQVPEPSMSLGRSDVARGSNVKLTGTKGTIDVTPGEANRRQYDENQAIRNIGPIANSLDFNQLISRIRGHCQGEGSLSISSSNKLPSQNPRTNAIPSLLQQRQMDHLLSNTGLTLSEVSMILCQQRPPQNFSFEDIAMRSIVRELSNPPNPSMPSNDARDRIPSAYALQELFNSPQLRQLRQLESTIVDNPVLSRVNNSLTERNALPLSTTGQRQQFRHQTSVFVERSQHEERVDAAERRIESSVIGAVPSDEDEKSLGEIDASQLLARFLYPNGRKNEDSDGKPSGNSSRAA